MATNGRAKTTRKHEMTEDDELAALVNVGKDDITLTELEDEAEGEAEATRARHVATARELFALVHSDGEAWEDLTTAQQAVWIDRVGDTEHTRALQTQTHDAMTFGAFTGAGTAFDTELGEEYITEFALALNRRAARDAADAGHAPQVVKVLVKWDSGETSHEHVITNHCKPMGKGPNRCEGCLAQQERVTTDEEIAEETGDVEALEERVATLEQTVEALVGELAELRGQLAQPPRTTKAKAKPTKARKPAKSTGKRKR